MIKKLTLIAVAGGVMLFAGADWLQFRGTSATSVSEEARPPLRWSESENVAWKAALPGRGPSSPIVIGDRVVVTCSSGIKQDRMHVLCFDVQSGKRLWERQFWATGRTLSHPTSANAAPTPASDGSRIFAFYASNDMVCLDLEGNLLWYRGFAHDYPKAGNDVGMASSPVVVDDTVIVQIENQGDSFAAGVNVDTGETRWRIARPARANWCSPVAVPAEHAVLLQSPDGLSAHEARTGEEIWRYPSECAGIASSVVLDGKIYLPSDGVTVLTLPKNSSGPEVLWNSNRLRPSSSSPVVYRGKVYTLNGAILVCADEKTGDTEWQLRLKGRFWATPVAVDDHLFCVNQDGQASVVKLGEKGKVVGESEFGAGVQGSPALAAGALFVRTDGHLWKIAATPK